MIKLMPDQTHAFSIGLDKMYLKLSVWLSAIQVLFTITSFYFLFLFQPRMEQYFTQMHKIVANKKNRARFRFMLQDVIDLRLVSPQQCCIITIYGRLYISNLCSWWLIIHVVWNKKNAYKEFLVSRSSVCEYDLLKIDVHALGHKISSNGSRIITTPYLQT